MDEKWMRKGGKEKDFGGNILLGFFSLIKDSIVVDLKRVI